MHCESHEVASIIKDCFETPELHELDDFITDVQHWFSSHACAAFIKQQSAVTDKTKFI